MALQSWTVWIPFLQSWLQLERTVPSAFGGIIVFGTGLVERPDMLAMRVALS